MAPPVEAVHRPLDVPLSDARCEGAVWILECLHKAGHEAFLVGGCVRDLLLGREPKDYDIATGARPEDVQAIFSQTVAVGRAFGVIMVIHGGREYDVATFRKDVEYQDGRRPESVSFCSVREDVLRRDFTINGLLYQHDRKQVVDYVGGLRDLDAGIVRAIGDPLTRFEEDHLRVLRAFRFSVQLKFRLERGTYDAALESAPKLVRISRERIRDEFIKMLSLEWFGSYFSDLHDSGVLAYLLPDWFERVAASDVWATIESRFPTLSSLPVEPSPGMYLALLLMPWSDASFSPERLSQELDRDLKGLKLSRSQEGWVREAILVACRVRGARGLMSRSALIRLARRDAFLEGMAIAVVEARVWQVACLNAVEGLFSRAMELDEEEIHPELFLNGGDLMEAGIPAGPVLGEVLREVEDAQLDGLVLDRDEALRFALKSAAMKAQQ